MVHSGINPDVDVPAIAFRVVVNDFLSMGVDLELRNERRRLVTFMDYASPERFTHDDQDRNRLELFVIHSTILSVSVIGLRFMSGRIPSATLGSADWGFGTRFGRE